MTAGRDEVIAELLPCPFCGSPAELVDEATFCYWVNCTGLDCYGHRDSFDNAYCYKADAIEKWNRREALSRVGGREAALKEAEDICRRLAVDQRVHSLFAKGAWERRNRIAALRGKADG